MTMDEDVWLPGVVEAAHRRLVRVGYVAAALEAPSALVLPLAMDRKCGCAVLPMTMDGRCGCAVLPPLPQSPISPVLLPLTIDRRCGSAKPC